jgi:hypothetical protein
VPPASKCAVSSALLTTSHRQDFERDPLSQIVNAVGRSAHLHDIGIVVDDCAKTWGHWLQRFSLALRQLPSDPRSIFAVPSHVRSWPLAELTSASADVRFPLQRGNSRSVTCVSQRTHIERCLTTATLPTHPAQFHSSEELDPIDLPSPSFFTLQAIGTQAAHCQCNQSIGGISPWH